ncbi:MAG: RluA family pseudouridine synthase [Clostridia bacterium]|jgi:23S rRNA pseudouridine955/2504/2580 synthase|nr:RluA family pseudouridine synthase [Clostridia bacterium]
MKELKITSKEQNQRLDKFLEKYFNTAPKSFIYKMLRKKRIKCNGKKASGSEIIQDGDTLTMYLSEETMDSFMSEKPITEAERHFGIIYEDENILVVSKPAGLLVHPEKSTDKNTLIDQIIYYLYEKGEYIPSKESSFTPAVCNRLDRNTGGIVLAGKNLQSVQAINKAIAEKRIQKFYVTMVKGEIKEPAEFYGYHIKNSDSNQVKILKKDVPGATKIYTKVKPIKVKDNFSLLEVELVTGKSHQIRAHLKSMGYNVIGDRKYGDERTNKKFREKFGLNNQFLYAYRVVWNENEGCLSYLTGREFFDKLPDNLETIRRAYFFNDESNET